MTVRGLYSVHYLSERCCEEEVSSVEFNKASAMVDGRFRCGCWVVIGTSTLQDTPLSSLEGTYTSNNFSHLEGFMAGPRENDPMGRTSRSHLN